MTEPGGETVSPPSSRPPLPPVLHPVVRSLLFVATFLAAQGATAVVFEDLLRRVSADGSGAHPFLQTSEAFVLLYAASLPALVLVTWIFLRFLDHRGFRTLGLRLPRGGIRAGLAQGLTAPLGAAGILAAWLAALRLLPDSLARFEAEGIAPGFGSGPGWWPAPPALLLGLLFLGFCLQGGIEEWVLRGYVFRSLRERWPPWRAALGSALLFAALHATNPSVSPLALLNIALAGFLLAGLAERTGSLWCPALAHGAWNFTVACILSVPISGFSMVHLFAVRLSGEAALTGGGFGPEGSLLLTPLAALGSWGVWRGRGRQADPDSGPLAPPREETPQAAS